MATAARVAVRPAGPTTVEELDRWDGDPGEIIDGVWTPTYPDGTVTGTGGRHGAVVFEIGALLKAFVRPRRLGFVVGGETAFVLRREPDLVRCADAAFIAAARLPAGLPAGAIRLAPSLAVEVRSPWDREAKVAQKVAEYVRHGTGAVWDVDPEARTVVVHRPGLPPQRLAGDDLLDGGDVLPGFSVPTSALFVDLDLAP